MQDRKKPIKRGLPPGTIWWQARCQGYGRIHPHQLLRRWCPRGWGTGSWDWQSWDDPTPPCCPRSTPPLVTVKPSVNQPINQSINMFHLTESLPHVVPCPHHCWSQPISQSINLSTSLLVTISQSIHQPITHSSRFIWLTYSLMLSFIHTTTSHKLESFMVFYPWCQHWRC